MSTREKVLEFIREFKVEHKGISPTIRQIMEGVGIKSTSTVAYHLTELEKEGHIILTSNKRIQLPHDFYAELPLSRR